MKQQRGFTLIEVLIALAILSIALTAIIKATSQNIRDTAYIQHKMIAHYVALDVINAARAGLINLPTDDGKADHVRPRFSLANRHD
jgi:general secretion pathway protein I